jgi:NADH-quinone oxidoreductase subunit F
MQRLSSTGELERYRNKILSKEDKGEDTGLCLHDRVQGLWGCRGFGRLGGGGQEAGALRPGGNTLHRVPRLLRQGPCAGIDPLGIQYQEVTPQDAAEIVDLTIKGNQLLDRLAYRDLRTAKPVFYKDQIPFYRNR